MSGIYIHIPFCKQACSYCNFHFTTSLKLKPELLNAIKIELELKKSYLNEPIETIYFGGGTPSLLEIDDINNLLEQINKHYNINNLTEITLEANPDDLKLPYLQKLIKTGINRLSIGVQTFNNESLIFLNRSHTANEAITAIKSAKNTGFSNITIDLIYGISGNDMKNLENDLNQMILMNIDHFSAYALTVEPKTLLAHQIHKKPDLLCSDEFYLKQFEMIIDFAKDHNYDHYEISNFARNQKFAIHNSNYWKNKAYIGIGPSAHSYNQIERRWNVSNNALYIKCINKNIPFEKSETLTLANRYNEYVMTCLRTMWGCDSNYILKNFGNEILQYFLKNINKHINYSTIINKNNIYYLSRKGKFVADNICSDLFLIEKNN